MPKTTCYPEKNQKYEMMTQAKMICANDPSCSGLVEAPKRRGQQKKFGSYSLTEREYILCSYPLSTKATDDTLLLKKRGKQSSISIKKYFKTFIISFYAQKLNSEIFLFRPDSRLCTRRNYRFELFQKYGREWLESWEHQSRGSLGTIETRLLESIGYAWQA